MRAPLTVRTAVLLAAALLVASCGAPAATTARDASASPASQSAQQPSTSGSAVPMGDRTPAASANASAVPIGDGMPAPDATAATTATGPWPDCSRLSFIGKFKDMAGPGAVLATEYSVVTGPPPAHANGYQIACNLDLGLGPSGEVTKDNISNWTRLRLVVSSTSNGTCAENEASFTPDPSAPGSYFKVLDNGDLHYGRCTGTSSGIQLLVSFPARNGVHVTRDQAAALVSAVQAALPEVDAAGAYCSATPSPCHG